MWINPELWITAGVVCVTSPATLFWALQHRSRVHGESGILEVLFPAWHPGPMVTIIDGHPHTLLFLSGVRGDRIINPGVSEFGQSSNLEDAYRIHELDEGAIVGASLSLLGL